MFLGHNSGNSFLDVMALVDRHWATHWFVDSVTNFLGFVISVGNRLALAILSGNLLAILLGNLLADLPGLIPAFFMSIDISALLLSNSLAPLLSHSMAGFYIPC